MNYKNSIRTPILTFDQRLPELTFIIELLRSYNIKTVDLLFGWPWGNEYGGWTPFQIGLDEILTKISEAEASGAGTFKEDDLSIIADKPQIELLFCHEYDLHLDFNDENTIVAAILDHWRTCGYQLTNKTPPK
ncbi:hypothetical protein GCM10028786_19500 [Flaviaesturariibacter terrae]